MFILFIKYLSDISYMPDEGHISKQWPLPL